MIRHLAIAAVALLSLSTVAQAQTVTDTSGWLGQPAGAFSGGLKLGTLGIGPEAGYRPLSYFGLRADAAFFSFDDSFHAGHVDYQGTAHFESYGLLADFYPFAESLRLTGGLRLNENDIRAHSNPNQPVTLSGLTIPSGTLGSLAGKITFDKFSPYLGFGWGGDLGSGFSLTTDFGVMFNGNPKASLTATGPATLIPGASAAVQAEQAMVQHDVNGYNYYPVLEIGVVYKF